MNTQRAKHLAILSTLALLATMQAAPAASLPQIAAAPGYGPVVLAATNQFGSGNNDALLVDVNAAGGNLWARTWGRVVDVYPADLKLDSDGSAVIVGSYPFLQQEEYVPTPAFVVKFDRNGTLLWEREINWADYSIRFNALDLDGSGGIYATGLAWKYADTPEPDGWYASRGFIFTCQLTSSGELGWAKRWAADEYAYNAGQGIVVAGDNVAVIADFGGGDTQGMLMLFYRSADGATLLSEAMVVPEGEFAIPAGLAVNNQGLVMGICTCRDMSIIDDNEQSSKIVMPFYTSYGDYIWTEMWYFASAFNEGSGRAVVYDITAIGKEFYLAASLGFLPNPRNPIDPTLPLHEPLILRYDGLLYHESQVMHDSSPSYVDSYFTSITSDSEETVYISGRAKYEDDYYAPKSIDWSGQAYSYAPYEDVPGWEDLSCGASSLTATGSMVTGPIYADVSDWLAAERIYGGTAVLDYVDHVPFAVVKADVLTGAAPLTVNVDALDSYIDLGSIDAYMWFVWGHIEDPDLPMEDGPTASYTFTEPGTYYVAVEVTSDDGSKSQAYVTVTVTQPAAT